MQCVVYGSGVPLAHRQTSWLVFLFENEIGSLECSNVVMNPKLVSRDDLQPLFFTIQHASIDPFPEGRKLNDINGCKSTLGKTRKGAGRWENHGAVGASSNSQFTPINSKTDSSKICLCTTLSLHSDGLVRLFSCGSPSVSHFDARSGGK